jgi:cytoplasmic polyadenylation element-binding protein
VFPQVQIIPWVLSDSNHVRQPSQRLDSSKTVFVGALHGMITAEILGNIMNDLFGNVVYAGIDTDKHKYPIGKHVYSLHYHLWNLSFPEVTGTAKLQELPPKFSL